jgi:hypothetical protein
LKKDQNPRFWSVLLVDIVNYSGLDAERQRVAIERLTNVVTKALKGIRIEHTDTSQHFFLPTGDGMIIGFAADYEGPVKLAREIHEKYGTERMAVKIGIHCGPAVRYKDIRKAWNFAGSSINMAARVESCCSGGHVLVAKEVADGLLALDESKYRPLLHEPCEFKVKWDKRITAFNYFDDERTFGNPSEPEKNRVYELDYVTLKRLLAELRVIGSTELREPEFARHLGEHPIIGNSVLDFAFTGFAGVNPDHLTVKMTGQLPQLPVYVWKTKDRIDEPDPNKKKAYLAGVDPPISDQNDFLGLQLGLSDYWTSQAVSASKDKICLDIKKGKIDPFAFHRELDCHLSVITADGKLVLGKRTKGVTAAKGKWGASLGEGIDGSLDLDDRGVLDPIKTIRRALSRTEELGLDDSVIRSADIKIIGLTTEWETLTSDLIVVVRLPKTGAAEVQDAHMTAADGQGEIWKLDFVDFKIDSCIPLMVRGSYAPLDSPALRAEIYGTSRVAILAALVHEFGHDKVRAVLEETAKNHLRTKSRDPTNSTSGEPSKNSRR